MNKIYDGMRYPSIDTLVSIVHSKYRLVVGTARRARDLAKGSQVLIEKPHSRKPIGIALEEIYEGKIVLKDIGENEVK
jgi:DNA-directed RNA polymerase subunit omega